MPDDELVTSRSSPLSLRPQLHAGQRPSLGKSQSALSQSGSPAGRAPEAASTHAHHPQLDATPAASSILSTTSPCSRARIEAQLNALSGAARTAFWVASGYRPPGMPSGRCVPALLRLNKRYPEHQVEVRSSLLSKNRQRTVRTPLRLGDRSLGT